MPQPKVSLAICTYNRADVLPRCLRAAVNQSIAPESYEVLVIDNASTDFTKEIVERFRRCFRTHTIRYLYHPDKGLSHARNRGAVEAASPIVHYIDDDAIADHHLLENILSVYQRYPQASVVGGEIRATFPTNLPDWFSSYFRGYYSELKLAYRDITQITDRSEFPFGANIGYRIDHLREAGLFSTRIGRIGKDFSGGEELDASYRIWLNKGQVFYTPHAVVEHLILPSRIHWEHITKSAAAAGRNWAYYEYELFRTGGNLIADFKHWLATNKQLGQAKRKKSVTEYHEALSKNVFYSAKLKRLIRYRLTPGGSRLSLNHNH